MKKWIMLAWVLLVPVSPKNCPQCTNQTHMKELFVVKTKEACESARKQYAEKYKEYEEMRGDGRRWKFRRIFEVLSKIVFRSLIFMRKHLAPKEGRCEETTFRRIF